MYIPVRVHTYTHTCTHSMYVCLQVHVCVQTDMHEQRALRENGKMEMFMTLVGHHGKLKAHAAVFFGSHGGNSMLNHLNSFSTVVTFRCSTFQKQ